MTSDRWQEPGWAPFCETPSDRFLKQIIEPLRREMDRASATNYHYYRVKLDRAMREYGALRQYEHRSQVFPSQTTRDESHVQARHDWWTAYERSRPASRPQVIQEPSSPPAAPAPKPPDYAQGMARGYLRCLVPGPHPGYHDASCPTSSTNG